MRSFYRTLTGKIDKLCWLVAAVTNDHWIICSKCGKKLEIAGREGEEKRRRSSSRDRAKRLLKLVSDSLRLSKTLHTDAHTDLTLSNQLQIYQLPD